MNGNGIIYKFYVIGWIFAEIFIAFCNIFGGFGALVDTDQS